VKVCIDCSSKFVGPDWECPSCGNKPGLVRGYPALAPELAEVNDGFDANFFAELANLEAGNFWFRSRNRLIIWALQRYFPEAQSFFEIGCGTGFVLSGIGHAFPRLSLFGSEIYSIGLTYSAERLENATLFQMDARKIPFENEFDIIGAFDVLEHIEEDEFVLSQIYKATCRDGGIILTVPQHEWLWSQTDKCACHVRRYESQDLRVKVEKAGFKVIKTTSFVSLLLPVMLISRLTKQRVSEQFDPMAELKVHGSLNFAFERMLGIERGLIQSGINLPLGGSLLLIGRKV